MVDDNADPERLGDGIHGFQEAAANGNALIQELRGTLAAFVNGQYSMILDTPVGRVRVSMEKNVPHA